MKRRPILVSFLFLLLLPVAACDDGGGGPGPMTAEEQEAFDYTNYARTDPQGFAQEFLYDAHQSGSDNGAYDDLMARQPVPALELSPGLFAAARAHSRDMDENCQNLQHDSCDGTSWSDRIRSYYDGGTIAENAAWGYPTGLDVVLGWIIDHNVPSLGHRINLLSGSYTHMGIGKAGSFWTQDFGAGGTN
jgi:hypothetical protein